MKKYLALIPSIAMVLLATILLGTAAYAWFAMNDNIMASNIVVEADVEGGIVISNSLGGTWADKAFAVSSGVKLLPTSTANATNWYHNRSRNIDDAQAGQAAGTYVDLTSEGKLRIVGQTSSSTPANGAGYYDADGDYTVDTGEKNYYLLNTFYIKSSVETISGHLYINKVVVTGINTSGNYDKCLRIAVVLEPVGTAESSVTKIFAPVAEATATYTVAGTTSITALTADNVDTGLTTIPASSDNSSYIAAKVYAYFEGEDANCKTTNVAGITIDKLNVSVIFGTTNTSPTTRTVTQNLTGVTETTFKSNVIISGYGDLVATYVADGAGGYSLPETVTVTIGGVEKTVGTDYSYSSTTGVLTIPDANITGNVVITVAGSHS